VLVQQTVRMLSVLAAREDSLSRHCLPTTVPKGAA
jgi:hypothetical protein